MQCMEFAKRIATNLRRPAAVKRLADFLEKFAVASGIWGIFRNSVSGVCIMLITLGISLYLSIKENQQ